MYRLAILLLFTLSSASLFAKAIPDFSAKYSVALNGIQAGELKRSLVTNTDGSRLFKSETQAKGIFALFKPEVIVETSLWSRHDHFIEPREYRYLRTGGKKDKMVALDFDWEAKQLHIDDKKHPWSLTLESETLDKLVYQLALMSDLADEKDTFNYRIADGGKIKQYLIIKISREVITTPLGKIEAIKLTRERSRPKDRKTTLWCAPSLNYLPVMLEHIEKDGTVFTAKIRRLRGINSKGAFMPLASSASLLE
jgi:hypothetical protein